MEVVINKCYGGFSLSKKAVARLAELQGKKAYFFKDGMGGKPRVPISAERETGLDLFWSAYTVPNPDEYMGNEPEWSKMTQEERVARNKKWDEISLDCRPENRADPLLVQVVKELGEEANGGCAELRIVEIPDGIEWHLDEYDGIESIHENHMSW